MQQPVKSKLQLALDHCQSMQEAHESLHGVPDNYNGVSAHPVTGVKQRISAYSDEWYTTFDRWMKAHDAVVARW